MRVKKCLVSDCRHNSNTYKKLLLAISKSVAAKWCSIAGIKFNYKKEYYCCEDHLKVEDAVENYQFWKLMGVQPKLNKNDIPHFQSNKENTQQPERNSSPILEGQSVLQELLLMPTTTNIQQVKESTPTKSTTSAIFIPFKHHIEIQCKPQISEKSTNYRCRNIVYRKSKEDIIIDEEQNIYPNDDGSSIVEFPSRNGSTTETSEHEIYSVNIRPLMLQLIEKHPKVYIGIPKCFYWIVQFISAEYDIDFINIIIVLYKIKQNDTIEKISHLFQKSRLQISAFFPSTIQHLANFFQHFIFLPDLKLIKRNLPLVFKIRYSDVQCIFDCFEIEITKASDPHSQSQSWSQYKGCNTAKYLVGCTPDGFITFISKGYGGRVSDKDIVEKSNLINYLPHNCVIMADRGFKAVEPLLASKNIKLLRPPSVYSGTKPEKAEVLKAKIIASLRVHVERLIRRLREFNFLKPHSAIKYQHLGYLDCIVVIASGLVNLQNKLIKDM